MTAPLSLTHSISSLFGNLKDGIRDLLFPAFCLECDKLLLHDEKIFCAPCLALLEFQNPYSRCPACFSKEGITSSHEKKCPITHSSLKKLVIAFEKIGPILNLAASFTKDRAYLARGIAAYMAAFWLELSNPDIDLVIPLPIPVTLRWQKGFDQNALIALEFAKIMGSKFSKQLTLSLESQPGKQDSIWFEPKIKDYNEIQDRNILIVALDSKGIDAFAVMADALQQGCPKSTHALTLF